MDSKGSPSDSDGVLNGLAKLNSDDPSVKIDPLKMAVDPREKVAPASGWGTRNQSYKNSEKLFNKYPHLKKFKPKTVKKQNSEQQQSTILESNDGENGKPVINNEQTPPAKPSTAGSSNEYGVHDLNLSRYKKAEINTKASDLAQSKPSPGNLSSSEDEYNENDSFERDDVDLEPENVDLKPEARFKVDQEVKENNENILNFLDKSRAIDIKKPKEDKNKVCEESKVVESNESDLSLAASSNSLNLKFYESSKDTSEIGSGVSSYQVDGSVSSKDAELESKQSRDQMIKNSKAKIRRSSGKNVQEKPKSDGKKKTSEQSPIKKGYFVRKKELEGTIGLGNTLGGLQSTEIQVMQFLGSGGEGKVYLGKITELDQLVAFKQFEVIENQEQENKIMEAIKREMKIVKKLSHPNVLKFFTIHKSSLDDDNAVQYNILMEYMEGGSLEALLLKSKSKILKLAMTKVIIKQILMGLEYLHEHRIIHRDLKPGNILMDSERKRIKIADFGVAVSVIGQHTNTKRTETGTAWYMAPEVIQNEPWSYPIDIYAVGCILYELISGKRPFYACLSKFAAMFAAGNNETPLDKSDRKVKKKFKDPNLLDFLDKCWDPNPNNRATAGELLSHPYLADSE